MEWQIGVSLFKCWVSWVYGWVSWVWLELCSIRSFVAPVLIWITWITWKRCQMCPEAGEKVGEKGALLIFIDFCSITADVTCFLWCGKKRWQGMPMEDIFYLSIYLIIICSFAKWFVLNIIYGWAGCHLQYILILSSNTFNFFIKEVCICIFLDYIWS